MWLSVTRSQVWMGTRCVKFGVIALTLSYWSLEVQHGTSWQRTLWESEKRIVAINKDGVGYKKIAKTLKLSCSTVAKTIQRFNWTGSTQNRSRQGWPKLSAHAQHRIQSLCLGNRCMSAASIAAEFEGVGGQPVSAQTIRRTLHQIGLHGCRPRRKPLLKMMHKKARKQFAEDKQTKDMDLRNHVLWSDETKINLFGSDGVKRVWRQQGEEYKDKCVLPTVKHGGGSVMVWGGMSAAGTGKLQFIEGSMNSNMYCDILKQSLIPYLQGLGRRAVLQHDIDHCLAKEAEGNAKFTLHYFSTIFHSPTGFDKSPVKCLTSEANRCSFTRVTIAQCELSKTRSEGIADASPTPGKYLAC